MVLHPQDVILALRLALLPDDPTYARLAGELGISTSQAHSAVARARECGLVHHDSMTADGTALAEFVEHGIRYVYPPRRGPRTRGIPTAHSSQPLSDAIHSDGTPVVWPDPDGPARGEGLEPLHRSALAIARNSELTDVHEALTLIDAIRGGRARERRLAIDLFHRKLA